MSSSAASCQQKPIFVADADDVAKFML